MEEAVEIVFFWTLTKMLMKSETEFGMTNITSRKCMVSVFNIWSLLGGNSF